MDTIFFKMHFITEMDAKIQYHTHHLHFKMPYIFKHLKYEYTSTSIFFVAVHIGNL